MKKMELPHNIHGERSHRVTCLTICDGDVWGGCPSGFVFCYSDAREEQEEQGERGGQNGGELVLCHQTQVCGEGRGMTGVNAMVGDKGGLVWVGAENGWLSVWKSVDGAIAGEEVKFRVSLLHQSAKISKFSGLTNQDSFLKLEFGMVSWKGLSSFLKRGKLAGGGKIEEVFLKDIEEVREKKGKLGGLGVVLVDKWGKERKFELENGEKEGRKALDLLKFGLFCLGEKRVLKRVGEHDLKRRVRALEMAGGRVWSFDDSLKVSFDFFLFYVCLFVCLFEMGVVLFFVFCIVLYCFCIIFKFLLLICLTKSISRFVNGKQLTIKLENKKEHTDWLLFVVLISLHLTCPLIYPKIHFLVFSQLEMRNCLSFLDNLGLF